MSDCANPGSYFEPMRVVINFEDGLRPHPLTFNRYTPEGVRRVASFDVDGTRYVRDAEGTIVNGVLALRHPDVDESAVIGVTLNGRRYVPAPEPDWDAECEVD